MFPRIGFALLSLTAVATMASVAEARSTISISGTGISRHEPELAEIRVEVTSICFDSPDKAQESNANLSKSILKLLQTYSADPVNLTASGGPNELNDESYVFDGHSQTLCKRKWRTTNTLKLKKIPVDKVIKLQNELVEAVADHSLVSDQGVGQSWAEVGSPTFTVTPDTEKAMQTEADGRAYDSAKRQRDDFVNKCGFSDLKLDSIATPTYVIYGGAPQQGGQAEPGVASSQQVIIPEQLELSATWNFVWSFEPGTNCAP